MYRPARLNEASAALLCHSEQTVEVSAQNPAQWTDADRSRTASLASFSRPSLPRALWQLANTLHPLPGSWIGLAWSRHAGWSYCVTLLLGVPTAALYVGCSSCSTTAVTAPSSGARRQPLGRRRPGVLTLFPFAYWKKTHAVHHATSGNLDQRAARRHPHAHRERIPRPFALGAVLLSLLSQHAGDARHRAYLPIRRQTSPADRHALALAKEWRSVALNNLALLRSAALCARCSAGARCWRCTCRGGDRRRIGVWLFYVQHTFEDSYWVRRAHWDPYAGRDRRQLVLRSAAAVRWITGNIGYTISIIWRRAFLTHHLRAAHAALPHTPGPR